MKWCFSTLGCYEEKLDSIIALAKRYHFNGIEVRGINNVMDNEEIDCFKEDQKSRTINTLKDNNLEFTVVGTSCKFHDSTTYEKYIIKAKKEIDIAYSLNFKAIRIFGNNIIDDKSIEYLTTAINKLCSYNRDIQILLETHGDFNNSSTLKPVIEKAGHNANFGLIWDIYHTYRFYGNNYESFYLEFKPYIKHVHIKDSLNGRPVLFGKGDVDYQSVIAQLDNDNYQGYISIEWEKKWFDNLEDLYEVIESLNIRF